MNTMIGIAKFFIIAIVWQLQSIDITEAAVDLASLPQHLQSNLLEPERCESRHFQNLKGWLIDLDGTMYNRQGLLPIASNGRDAKLFHKMLIKRDDPYVYLSNGFKSRECLSAKFSSEPFKLLDDDDLQAHPFDEKWAEKHVHTAALSLANYMIDEVGGKAANIFVIATSSKCGDKWDSSHQVLHEYVDEKTRKQWNIRMDLDIEEVKDIALQAIDKENPVPAYVLFAIETNPLDSLGGTLDSMKYPYMVDKVFGRIRSAYKTFDYELATKVTILIRNKAHLVFGAPDLLDAQPPLTGKYSELDPHWPSIGALEHLFLAAGEMSKGSDAEKNYHFNTGKGGNEGGKYMMLQGLEQMDLLDDDKKNVFMIGDNFGTDIKAAVTEGFSSVFVLSGVHSLHDYKQWKIPFTCYVDNVGEIVKRINELDADRARN